MHNESISQLIPVHACDYEVNEGIVTALYRKESRSFIDKILFSKLNKTPYKIDFDEIGSFVWQQIDGVRSVNEITNICENHFAKGLEQAGDRIELFVKELARTKLITLYKKR